ncbi:hypothetical protein [Ensifer sp. SSB1]|jgi:hypothetical protein|uniref:hypothetical protein n=1 Tax=Ensifer sp. SSB1 TaxID=2795385 RepID=UPI001A3DE193|nr:hypothetical protein [Ensifer sp. SSB1]MBK5567417.1 hypothetical protein [Ensifer sp. SSB1]
MMLDLDEATARRIIDAVANAIDGKDASAKTFGGTPFDLLSEFDAWGQGNNNSKNDTTRTDALTIAYLLFTGGRIPLTGIQMDGVWFRPDKWIIGALVKKGRAIIDEQKQEIALTAAGWSWVAGVLEALSKTNKSAP